MEKLQNKIDAHRENRAPYNFSFLARHKRVSIHVIVGSIFTISQDCFLLSKVEMQITQRTLPFVSA